MQNSFSTKLIDLVAKRGDKKKASPPMHKINKNNLNQLVINIFKTLNIDEMCNALLKKPCNINSF